MGGRLLHFPVQNVLQTQTAGGCWADYTKARMAPWFNVNYVSPTPVKREWHEGLSSLVRDGKVKSLLDAGAGSCTLAGHLRRAGLMQRLNPYVAFGSYDCSMLRICGERGAISFQYNWLNSLPFCRGCKFDMVFQAEGIHHIQGKENITKSLDHF